MAYSFNGSNFARNSFTTAQKKRWSAVRSEKINAAQKIRVGERRLFDGKTVIVREVIIPNDGRSPVQVKVSYEGGRSSFLVDPITVGAVIEIE